jgi:hypothetical protein
MISQVSLDHILDLEGVAVAPRNRVMPGKSLYLVSGHFWPEKDRAAHVRLCIESRRVEFNVRSTHSLGEALIWKSLQFLVVGLFVEGPGFSDRISVLNIVVD